MIWTGAIAIHALERSYRYVSISSILLPPVSKPTLIELKVVAGDFSMKNSITLDPENAKFRWRCEASWPVHESLKCRPASQIERYRNGNSAYRISDRQFASFHNCQRSDKAMEWSFLMATTIHLNSRNIFQWYGKRSWGEFQVIRGAWPRLVDRWLSLQVLNFLMR